MTRKKTHDEYLEELLNKKVKFNPLEPYNGKDTPILHECINKHQWLVRPSCILKGRGCPHCAGVFNKTPKMYIDELKNKNIPYVPLENYTTSNVKISHKCKNCEHIWLVTPSHILSGRGCPNCRGYGFKENIPGILYLVELDINSGEALYKLGITNNNPKIRLAEDFNKFKATICWFINFELGSDARKLESYLKKEYKDYQYNTGLLKSGNTETFSCYINKPENIIC